MRSVSRLLRSPMRSPKALLCILLLAVLFFGVGTYVGTTYLGQLMHDLDGVYDMYDSGDVTDSSYDTYNQESADEDATAPSASDGDVTGSSGETSATYIGKAQYNYKTGTVRIPGFSDASTSLDNIGNETKTKCYRHYKSNCPTKIQQSECSDVAYELCEYGYATFSVVKEATEKQPKPKKSEVELQPSAQTTEDSIVGGCIAVCNSSCDLLKAEDDSCYNDCDSFCHGKGENPHAEPKSVAPTPQEAEPAAKKPMLTEEQKEKRKQCMTECNGVCKTAAAESGYDYNTCKKDCGPYCDQKILEEPEEESNEESKEEPKGDEKENMSEEKKQCMTECDTNCRMYALEYGTSYDACKKGCSSACDKQLEEASKSEVNVEKMLKNIQNKSVRSCVETCLYNENGSCVRTQSAYRGFSSYSEATCFTTCKEYCQKQNKGAKALSKLPTSCENKEDGTLCFDSNVCGIAACVKGICKGKQCYTSEVCLKKDGIHQCIDRNDVTKKELKTVTNCEGQPVGTPCRGVASCGIATCDGSKYCSAKYCTNGTYCNMNDSYDILDFTCDTPDKIDMEPVEDCFGYPADTLCSLSGVCGYGYCGSAGYCTNSNAPVCPKGYACSYDTHPPSCVKH